MKIYFTAATSFDGELNSIKQRIISIVKELKYELLSGEQTVDKMLLEKDRRLPSKDIFTREKHLIDQAGLVIAEASRPSLGVGSEITYALTMGKPVLVLVHKDYEDKISPMIAGNPSDNLYIEYYSEDNLYFKIKDFTKHIHLAKAKRGKLIVIDGGNGSGKTTQAKLLVDHLKNKKITTKYMDFPQYYHSFHGKTVAKFLRGEFGGIDQVSPYLASLAFALDRASVKREMDKFLAQGGFIIANRYATSNMAHQGAKFNSETERKEFLNWVYELEYKVHKIPKEDLVIYLHVPWQLGIELTAKKGERDYLKGKKDIEEKDLNNRMNSEKLYMELSKKYKHWLKIDCIEKNKLLSREMIHQKIITLLETKNIL